MDERLPLSVLLSHALVAYTIEFDNEAEHRLPHSTTYGTSKELRGPWLVSMVMWWNCMRFVSDEGVTVRELERLARTATNLDGMRRWGYIRITPDTAAARSKKPKPDAVLRPTTAGRRAQKVWPPLLKTIEQRWEERFGKDAVDRLRDALRRLIAQFENDLPDCMPILHYGLATKVPDRKQHDTVEAGGVIDDDMALAALLAKALIAFALEFEAQSEMSLAVCANVLRVIGDEGVRVRDLPRLSGVSKEAIAMAMGLLKKEGYAQETTESPASRVKVVVLTAKGVRTRERYRELVTNIEKQWQARFGEDVVRALRGALEDLGAGAPAEESRLDSPLFAGLKPYADGWRAAVRKPETLPHFPMVLHRGGYPDGS